MYSVYQHWDPLKTCVVGRCYPPEFFSWIKDSRLRNQFEKIAIETEEDFQQIVKKLKTFNVEVLRPNLPENNFINGQYLKPPITPRDYMVMIGTTLYHDYQYWYNVYGSCKQEHWPGFGEIEKYDDLDPDIQAHLWSNGLGEQQNQRNCYSEIWKQIEKNGNTIAQNKFIDPPGLQINGANVSRLGKDLYFATWQDGGPVLPQYQQYLDETFTDTRNHVVNTGGHGDGCYCPVTPGLIFSIYDVPRYEKTFPDWEVVYLENQGWKQVTDWEELKGKNDGKWWIPGCEKDQDVINTVTTYLDHWVGFVEETVFDVNMLIIDPKNVMVFSYNDRVFEALDRYGITPHVVPFRHRFFWDGGIHCVTLDLDRHGKMKNYFPNR